MKKSNNLLLKTLLLLFVLFLIFYISKGAGFYEYKAYTKSRLTSEAMEKFESDLAAGKDVTIEEYIQIGQTNYSNAVSKTGYKRGTLIEKFMNTGIQKVLKVLEKLF